MSGTLYGVGLGPGDPELITLKAARIIANTKMIAYFAKAGRRGNARVIADGLIPATSEEIPLLYPVTTEIEFRDPAYAQVLRDFYETATADLGARLDAGHDVALLCEGDPFFYGSFMHLWRRLVDRFPVEVIAGVPGMAGCWARAGRPITWGDDVLTVLPGTLDEATLAHRLSETDAAVVMKIGRNLPKIRRAVIAAGRHDHAIYVERGTMTGEKVMKLADKDDDAAPYFAMILIPGEGRRP